MLLFGEMGNTLQLVKSLTFETLMLKQKVVLTEIVNFDGILAI